MKTRILKISNGGQTTYFPQYQKHFLWFNWWEDISFWKAKGDAANGFPIKIYSNRTTNIMEAMEAIDDFMSKTIVEVIPYPEELS